MAKFRTYDYKCSSCKRKEVFLIDVETEDFHNSQACKCGGEMEWCFPSPQIRTETSATYLDGQRRNSKDWKNTLRQQELEDEVHSADDFADQISANIELSKFKGTLDK